MKLWVCDRCGITEDDDDDWGVVRLDGRKRDICVRCADSFEREFEERIRAWMEEGKMREYLQA